MAEDISKTAEDLTQGAQTPETGVKPDGASGALEDMQSPADGVSEPLTDKHGQPAIARGKYERDIAAKDKEIEALKAQVAEAAKTEEGRKQLTEQVDALKAEIANMELAHKLEAAGCKSVKAAKALLEDYEGDVARLKEALPWLFEDDKPRGKTGLKPDGAVDDAASRLAKARADLGIKVRS